VGIPQPVMSKTQLEQIIAEKLSSLPFFVERTAFGMGLPVYSDIKNGHTRRLTIIRRIYGDIPALSMQLKRQFPDMQKVTVKPLQQKIVVKGDWVSEIKLYLTDLGF
jgi:large subunit ribosomal protein L49